MPIRLLTDYLEIFRELAGKEAVVYDNGYRCRSFSYRWLVQRSETFARFLNERGSQKGDRLLLWSENRPEWLIAYWGCVLTGVQVVPLDYRSTWNFVKRVQDQVKPLTLIAGDQVQPGQTEVSIIRVGELAELPAGGSLKAVSAKQSDAVQILFTSGTTAEPHGIIHTHQNLCANLNPMSKEIEKYRRYSRLFQPIRMLSLLPLSHVFGQAFAMFIPPLLGGSTVLVERLNPQAVVEVVRREKVSVLAVVPKLLSNLQNEVTRKFGITNPKPVGSGWWGALRRWVRYRSVHRYFGLKFWSLVVGGAPVSREQEDFWTALGLAVIQGYGLTESTAMVSLNHPFDRKRGSLGKVLPGFQVRIAEDGEILIRGKAVANAFLDPESDSELLTEGGWLASGDLGSIDDEGRLYFRGRKKEVIVTAEGMNVFPGDVEAVLKPVPGVRAAVVLAKPTSRGDVVHSVLILESGVDPDEAVSRANRALEPHQRIQEWSIWPHHDFPRTASTLKLRRSQVADWLCGQSPTVGAKEERLDPIDGLIEQLDQEPPRDLRLDQEIGLSSLDRLELLSRLEERFSVSLNEETFAEAQTLSRVHQLVATARSGNSVAAPAPIHYPRWSYGPVWRRLRWLFREFFMLPLLPRLLEIHSQGHQNLAAVSAPVIFAANHSSHLDTAVILAALPTNWRHRLAPAMSKKHFAPYFTGTGYTLRQRAAAWIQYGLACALFGAYPLPPQGGVRQSMEFTGELIDRGYCPLIFPEGRRSRDGKLMDFQNGVGLWAIRLNVTVVPVFISGTFDSYSVHDHLPSRGSVSVRFHTPMKLARWGTAEHATAALRGVIRQTEKEHYQTRSSLKLESG